MLPVMKRIVLGISSKYTINFGLISLFCEYLLQQDCHVKDIPKYYFVKV